MHNQHNSKSVQAHLNLNRRESLFADDLRTEEVSKLVEIITKEKVSTRDIRDRARNSRFEIPYLHGAVVVAPSHKGKSSRYRWDVILAATSLVEVSA